MTCYLGERFWEVIYSGEFDFFDWEGIILVWRLGFRRVF